VLKAYRLLVAEELTMSGDKNFDRSTLEHALAELGQRVFAAGDEDRTASSSSLP
jgi:hypothetical protein